MSLVKCNFVLIFFYFLANVVELVGGGSVINGTTPSSLEFEKPLPGIRDRPEL